VLNAALLAQNIAQWKHKFENNIILFNFWLRDFLLKKIMNGLLAGLGW